MSRPRRLKPGLLPKNQPGLIERATPGRSQPTKERRLPAQLKRRARLSAMGVQVAKRRRSATELSGLPFGRRLQAPESKRQAAAMSASVSSLVSRLSVTALFWRALRFSAVPARSAVFRLAWLARFEPMHSAREEACRWLARQ